jgi:hypothetical protein
MGERPTLLMTTRLGVRPLGVRGDPLHAVAGQLLAVIRRRLGDGPANLLADPQLRESGDGIDWYSAQSGSVQRLSELGESERADVLRAAEAHLDAIRTLGAQLQASATSEEARLIGRSLELATARPSDDFVFVVDGQPVIVAWGYEADAAASLQPFALTPVPAPAPPAAILASAPAVSLPGRLGWAPWLSALLFGLLLLLLLLLTLVAVARVRAGRSVAQHCDSRNTRAACPRSAARSDSTAQGLTRRREDRRAKAEGGACLATSRAEDKAGAVQADRTAQAAASSASCEGPASAAAGDGTACTTGAAREPSAARSASLRLVGDSGGERRHAQSTLSRRQTGFRGVELSALRPAGRYQGDLSRPADRRHWRPAQRPRRFWLRLEAGRRGIIRSM